MVVLPASPLGRRGFDARGPMDEKNAGGIPVPVLTTGAPRAKGAGLDFGKEVLFGKASGMHPVSLGPWAIRYSRLHERENLARVLRRGSRGRD